MPSASAVHDKPAEQSPASAARDVLFRVERMEQARRPECFTEAQWYTLLRDLRDFTERHLEHALGCGWSMLDLYGHHPDIRAHRWGMTGLVVMLDGREIASIDADRILVANRLGAPNTFYRHSPGCSAPFDHAGAVLVWAAALSHEGLTR